MPKSFNPFEAWLGLAPNLANPNHFQLLGLSSESSDSADFAESVRRHAKHARSRLAKIPVGTHDKVTDQLEKRILTAETILADREKCREYLKRIQPRHRSERDENRFRGKPQTAKPVAKPNSIATPHATRGSQSDVRSAIPLAKPIPEIEMVGPVGVAKRAATASVESDTGSSELNESGFSIQASAGRNSGGRTGKILAAGIVVVILIGSVLVYQNLASLLVLGGIKPAPAEVDPPDDLDVPPVIAQETPIDQPIDPGESLVPQVPVEPETESTLTPTQTPKPHPLPEREKERVELTPEQLTLFVRSIGRARRSMARREPTIARQEIDAAAALIQSAISNDNSHLAESSEKLHQMVIATRQIHTLVNGFWRQVAENCQTIPGGQEIRIQEQVLAFVEANDDHVILRNAGSNVTYAYEILPAGLAMILANEAAIEDVAIWSMQQAAVYAVNESEETEFSNRVEDLVATAESFGHDCTNIRCFVDFEIEENQKPPRLPVLAPPKRKILISKFRENNNYDSPRSLGPRQAQVMFENVFHLEASDSDVGSAYLFEALALGVRSGSASRVEDAIMELNLHSDIDSPRITCNSYLRLSKSSLNPDRSRQLLERAIPFLKSADGKKAPKQLSRELARRLTQMATELSMLDALRRLDQLD